MSNKFEELERALLKMPGTGGAELAFAKTLEPGPDVQLYLNKNCKTEAERNALQAVFVRYDYQGVVNSRRAREALEPTLNVIADKSLGLAQLIGRLSVEELKAATLGLKIIAANIQLYQFARVTTALLRGLVRMPEPFRKLRPVAELQGDVLRLVKTVSELDEALRPMVPLRDTTLKVFLKVAHVDLDLREQLDRINNETFDLEIEMATLAAEVAAVGSPL
jgi:hypothetical protein